MFNTDQLQAIADQPALWLNVDGMSNTLRAALARAAQISNEGRTPHKLHGPGDVEVDRNRPVSAHGY